MEIHNLKDKYKNKKWPTDVLGYIVYKRTYAREIEGENRTEDWNETIQRVISAIKKYNFKFTDIELTKLYDYMFNLKGIVSGRGLWQLGTKTVDRFGGDSLLNCWFTTIQKPVDFCFLMEELMLGGGVVFSIKREHVHEFQKIKRNVSIIREDEKDADLIVPDKREGWMELLRHVMT